MRKPERLLTLHLLVDGALVDRWLGGVDGGSMLYACAKLLLLLLL